MKSWIFDPGRKHGNGEYFRREGSFVGVCRVCETRRFISRLSLIRSSTPKCGCGGILDLTSDGLKRLGAKVDTIEPGTCIRCGSKLHLRSKERYCGLCIKQLTKILGWERLLVLREFDKRLVLERRIRRKRSKNRL